LEEKMSRADVKKWALISAAATGLAWATLPVMDLDEDADAAELNLIGDSEIPNPVIDDLFVIASDAVSRLISAIVD
jgi:hypothetical protein